MRPDHKMAAVGGTRNNWYYSKLIWGEKEQPSWFLKPGASVSKDASY
jgi:hypothetical protein